MRFFYVFDIWRTDKTNNSVSPMINLDNKIYNIFLNLDLTYIDLDSSEFWAKSFKYVILNIFINKEYSV